MMRIALDLKPDQATLVQETEGEVTTEGGLDAASLGKRIATAIRKL